MKRKISADMAAIIIAGSSIFGLLIGVGLGLWSLG